MMGLRPLLNYHPLTNADFAGGSARIHSRVQGHEPAILALYRPRYRVSSAL